MTHLGIKEFARFKINNCLDRERVVLGLVNSGHRVQVHEEKIDGQVRINYFVVVYETGASDA